MLAAIRANAAGGYFGYINIFGIGNVALHTKARIVIALFICAAREVVCALKRAVINNSEVAA